MMSANPKKLLELAAVVNGKHGHQTETEKQFLVTQERLRHGRPIGEMSRKERRIARAKAREEMGLSGEKGFQASAVTNQCDGCMAGIPVDENGHHRMGEPSGYPDLMECTARLYK